MKTLFLLRHAKSSWDDTVARDFDRPLNAKGKRAAAAMGRHLRDQAIAFDHVVASPALRVRETLEHFGSGYGRAVKPEWDKRVYLASAEGLLDRVHALPDAHDCVLLSGHNPGLEDLVLMLASGADQQRLRAEVAQKFPTASFAALTFPGTWREIDAGSGTLDRFIRPRDVDPTLGPDPA